MEKKKKVGQIDLINEIFSDDYQIICEIQEGLYLKYFQLILHS